MAATSVILSTLCVTLAGPPSTPVKSTHIKHRTGHKAVKAMDKIVAMSGADQTDAAIESRIELAGLLDEPIQHELRIEMVSDDADGWVVIRGHFTTRPHPLAYYKSSDEKRKIRDKNESNRDNRASDRRDMKLHTSVAVDRLLMR